jgi:cytohesin
MRRAAFLEAARLGDGDAVRAALAKDSLLVRATGDYAKTALHFAAEKDHLEVAEILVNAGADLEARTNWNATPFDWAAAMGGSRVADLLLSRGASGLTVITAASLGKLADVRAILDGGADLATHRRRDAPATPDRYWPAGTAHIRGDVLSDALYGAARNGHTETVAYLLERGADIDARGVFGATGLHWAAINGHRETVEFLVAHGADLSIGDPEFAATPEGWAREGGHGEIATFLKRAAREVVN